MNAIFRVLIWVLSLNLFRVTEETVSQNIPCLGRSRFEIGISRIQVRNVTAAATVFGGNSWSLQPEQVKILNRDDDVLMSQADARRLI
jgi:hypothetical protein